MIGITRKAVAWQRDAAIEPPRATSRFGIVEQVQ